MKWVRKQWNSFGGNLHAHQNDGYEGWSHGKMLIWHTILKMIFKKTVLHSFVHLCNYNIAEEIFIGKWPEGIHQNSCCYEQNYWC